MIGQVDNKYILFTSNDQLLCLDQHAIHERILLEEMEEKLKKKMIQNSISTAQLDTRCQVSSIQGRVLNNQRYRQHLMSWGFHYSINKNSSLLISTTPVIEGESLTRLDFIEFVDYLFRNEDLPILTLKPPSVNRILASKACRTAIKFGDPIPFQECEKGSFNNSPKHHFHSNVPMVAQVLFHYSHFRRTVDPSVIVNRP